MDFAFTEEQLLFKEQVRKFARREMVPRCQDHDLKGQFDYESFRKMGEFGLLGLHLPEAFGGSGADVVTSVLAAEALGEAGVDGGLTLSYGAHTYLVPIRFFPTATEAQRREYVPRLASGALIGCMGLTEPGAGSDVTALSTRAVKQGDHYLLNGSKMFITNGPIADVAVVYARTSTVGERHEGISAFIIEKGTKGFSAGNKLNKMGVRILVYLGPLSGRLPGPGREPFGPGRPGISDGHADRGMGPEHPDGPFPGRDRLYPGKVLPLQPGERRPVPGGPIADFQAIKHKIADISIFLEAARSLIYRIAWCKDQGRPLNHLEAAVAKLFVGDGVWSRPIMAADPRWRRRCTALKYDAGRATFRDSRLAPIGGGTSEIQKMIISCSMT